MPPLLPWNDPFMPTWDIPLRLEVERHITGKECYYELYGDEPNDIAEDPRCLADGLDGFGTPY